MKHEKIVQYISRFRQNERGAVTVDWVVLVAGVVGLAVAAFAVVETQTTDLADSTGEYIGDRTD